MKKEVLEQVSAAQTGSVIGASVKVKGNLVSEGNIEIHGEVEGEIKTLGDVYVGEGAKISADISAQNAEVAGKVKGNISVADHLKLSGTAEVKGDISAKTLGIDPGAVFVGKSSMARESSSSASAEKVSNLTPKYEIE